MAIFEHEIELPSDFPPTGKPSQSGGRNYGVVVREMYQRVGSAFLVVQEPIVVGSAVPGGGESLKAANRMAGDTAGICGAAYLFTDKHCGVIVAALGFHVVGDQISGLEDPGVDYLLALRLGGS